MKNFLNRVKATLFKYTVLAAWITLAIVIVVLHPIYVAYNYVSTKVRGAISWIADKYNSVVSSFTSTVAE